MSEERLHGVQDAFMWLLSTSDDFSFDARFSEALAQLNTARQLNEQIIKYYNKTQFELNLKELELNIDLLKQKI